MRPPSAFSLVELSIVLVILGLLVGGILAGKSLIRASELRSVTTEHHRYITAMKAFQGKYFMLPGDISNAESFWGQLNATNATCRDSPTTGTDTCNGNGDGVIEVSSSRSREIYRFWQHLANAGLIEGSYTGTYVGAASWGVTRGGNIPASKLGSAGWAVVSRTNAIAQGGWYNSMFFPSSEHWLEFGGNTSANSYLIDPMLKAEEAWNIDSKTDDGLPGTGKITTFNNSYYAYCASSNVAASATYRLDRTEVSCTMLMGL